MISRNCQHPLLLAYFIDFIESNNHLAGGTERQLIAIIKQLDKSKFKPILFALRGKESSNLWESLDCEKYLLGVTSLFSINSLKNLFKTAFILRRRGVFLAHSFFFDATVFGVLSSRLAGVPKIISSRRDLGFWYTTTKLRVLKSINLLTDNILVNSKAIKKEIVLKESVARKKINVIYNGIDFALINRNSHVPLPSEFTQYISGRLSIGIVANFDRPVKRVDLFIQAASIVARHRHDVCFVVIGGGNLDKKLKLMALDLGVGEKIIFLGALAAPAAYMKCFDIGVVPSDSEGFPNVILEYMALSVPVVATDVGGNSELVRQGINGLLVPPNNKLALAGAIQKLLDDRALRMRLAANARIQVQNEFSWPVQIRHIENFYKSVALG